MNGLQNMFKSQPSSKSIGGININQILSKLTGIQKQNAINYLNQTKEKQAETIANWCNQNGITKEQLEQFINQNF